MALTIFRSFVLKTTGKEMQYPVFLDSVPKSGTHLLAKALLGFPGVAHSGKHMDRKTIAEFVDKDVAYPTKGREDINIQSDFPWIKRLFQSIPAGQFLTAHLPYHPAIHETLERMNFKILVMMRDPRDVVLSWADYIAKEKNHLLNPFFKDTDRDYRIICGIKGVSSEITKTRRQPPIADLINGHMRWKTRGGAFLVQFEQLVGEKGGGSRESQYHLLEQLMDYLEIKKTSKALDQICDTLFGGTYTFNSGTIGRWRTQFTDEHKALFKKETGRLLIDAGYEKDTNW
jgi:hypothetical protein